MKKIFLSFALFFCHHSFAKLNPKLVWYGNNAEALSNHFETWKKNKEIKYAAFDWDNTMVKNDVGNAFFYWMITHNLIKTQNSWKEISPYLTKKAVEELSKTCPFDDKSPVLKTSSNIPCLDLLLNLSDGMLTKDEKAFDETKYNPNLIEPAYVFVAELLAGYTHKEIKEMAKDMKTFQLSQLIGNEEKIGTKTVDGYIRFYDQMKDLVKEFKKEKFEVYIISASAQPIVEVFARDIGIDSKHVIGIRQIKDKQKKLTNIFEACEGNSDLITFREGKRCWLKKIVNAPMNFAAGDSDTDFQFVSDATDLRLVINRNKAELMCHAYGDTDGKWIVNPMFINPKPKKATPYSCEKYGLADQEDKVF